MRNWTMAAVVAVVGLAFQVEVRDAKAYVVVEGLEKEAISKVTRAHQGEMKACYEEALSTAPGLAGKVTVAFTIAGDGTVTVAEVAESTVGHEGLEQCLLARVRSWRFPEPRGGGLVQVTYPWVFRPGE